MKLYSYDISSAYPFEASQLLDLRDCSFTRSSDVVSSSLLSSACYGFLVGDFTVYPDHPLAFCSPFIADRGDGTGTQVNFTGTVHDYPCLLDEVRALSRYDLGEFHLKSGWFISPLNGVRPRLPFKSIMESLYSQRGDDELKSYLVKRVMNGVIGKLLESRKDGDGNVIEYGEHYSPIYHALCTTRTRLRVFDFLVQNGITREELVHVGVDGVKTTRHISLPAQSPMGKWRCSGSEPTIVLSPGAVLTPGRNFKRTGYNELLAECLLRQGAYKLGRDPNDPIDLRRLFVNQTRVFKKLPHNGLALLVNKYPSDPVELGG